MKDLTWLAPRPRESIFPPRYLKPAEPGQRIVFCRSSERNVIGARSQKPSGFERCVGVAQGTKKCVVSVAEPSARDVSASSQGDDGRTEFTLAQKYLSGSGVHEDQNAAVQLLWVAVGKGNSEAELELADLYLRGDGALKQNCEQARILLTAASNKGNPLASQKIAELGAYGCRE